MDRARDWFLDARLRDSVRGYLQETQAMALCALLDRQAELGITGSLAEIGVFLGKTLIGLVRASRPDEHVLAIDPLRLGDHELQPELTRNLRTHLTEAEIARLTLRRNLSTRLTPADWMGSLKLPARFIHLDGHHARETMLHDLQLATSWLQQGGLVVIDDFLNELHPDLTTGILDGLQAHPQLEPVAVIPRMGHIEEGGSKLVCATRGGGAAYLGALDATLSVQLRPWKDSLFGRDVRVYRSKLPTPNPKARAEPARTGEPLCVVFALHDKEGTYWPNTAVALNSLARYATAPLRAHLLHDDTLTDVARIRLGEIAREAGAELALIKVDLPDEVKLNRLKQFGPASLFRLLIPKLFATEDLVIYLDSDLVVNGIDIRRLAEAAPLEAAISAVTDAGILNDDPEILRMGLDPAGYVNSGVLVLRPRLIEEDLLQAFIDFSNAHPKSIHPDQDFLNLHFKDRIHRIDERFNFQVTAYEQRLIQPLDYYGGKILHYVGKIKPLDGSVASGLIPFWIHAQPVADVAGAMWPDRTKYLTPVEGQPHTLSLVHLVHKPPSPRKAK